MVGFLIASAVNLVSAARRHPLVAAALMAEVLGAVHVGGCNQSTTPFDLGRGVGGIFTRFRRVRQAHRV